MQSKFSANSTVLGDIPTKYPKQQATSQCQSHYGASDRHNFETYESYNNKNH